MLKGDCFPQDNVNCGKVQNVIPTSVQRSTFSSSVTPLPSHRNSRIPGRIAENVVGVRAGLFPFQNLVLPFKFGRNSGPNRSEFGFRSGFGFGSVWCCSGDRFGVRVSDPDPNPNPPEPEHPNFSIRFCGVPEV
jgi:hypothetical protein